MRAGKSIVGRAAADCATRADGSRSIASVQEEIFMPEINADGCRIHVEVEGPEQAPVLMLSNSLGTNLHMWDDQVAALASHFRLVRYDRRGHGQSDVPKGPYAPRGHGQSDVPKAPYSMERLGRDVLAILDGLGIAKASWFGLSIGGM